MKLLLIGVTGLVGRHVLELALADQRTHEIVAFTRRELPVQHPKLRQVIVDFGHLPRDPLLWQVDAVICTLGTTMRAAGSKQAFERVDRLYPLRVAQRARARRFDLCAQLGRRRQSPIAHLLQPGQRRTGAGS